MRGGGDGPPGKRDERVPRLRELVFDAGADHANELHQRILVRARHTRKPTLIDRLDKAGL